MLCQLSDHIKDNYVKNRYISSQNMHTLQNSNIYTDLQLVKYRSPCGEKEIFDIAAMMRRGLQQSSDMRILLSESQATIENSSFIRIKNIFDILKPIQNNEACKPEVIIIEGAPGIGKTTLCKEIAYQWATNQSLAYLKLVLFISVQNNINMDKIKSLEDFILYFYNFDETAADFAKQCAGILHKRNNCDILVVLDGYHMNQDFTENAFLTQIVSHKVLGQSRIIITPQSVATSKLQAIADLRIEILGFSDENKKEYIENEFQGSQNKIEVLSSYLSANKNINGICYVPMIMSVVVQAYKETQELPENQTEFYQNIISLIISRCIQKYDESKSLRYETLLLQDLPEVYQSHLLVLAKVAFNCLKSGKIVFSNSDLEISNSDFPLLNHALIGLGLLKVSCLNDCFSYSFLHSSIQEFLATYYIHCQEPRVQFELLRNTFFLEEYTSSWILFTSFRNNAFLDVLNYSLYCKSCVAATNLLQKIRSLDVIENFINLTKDFVKSACTEAFRMFCIKTIETKFYNTQCLWNSTDEHSIMNKIGVNRASWNKIYLSLYHDNEELIECFVLDKNVQENVYSRIASQLNANKDLSVVIVNPSSLLAYRANNQQIIYGLNVNQWMTSFIMRDCLVTDEASTLMSACIKTSKLKLVNFTGCEFSNNNIDKIFASLSKITSLEMIFFSDIDFTEARAILVASIIASNNKLYILDLTKCKLQHNAALSVTAALKNISALQTLTFDNCELTKDVADDLAVALYINQGLKRLRLPNNKLQSGGASIASALCQIKTLTELNLKNNNLSENAIDELSSVIKTNKSLQTLNLSGNNLKTNGIIKITQPLSIISNLTVLIIQNNRITEGAADAIAIAILSNRKLEELYLGDNNLAEGITKISTALQYLTTLKVLDINNNNAPEEAAKELTVAIYNNRLELETLWLANNNFRSSITLIADSLTKTNTLKDIDLSGNGIPEEVAGDIASVIDSNRSLQSVRLSNNLLMSNGMIKIAQSLSKLSTLTLLHISENKIDDRAAEAVAAVILNNSKLDDLFLNYNQFQTGTIMIAKALRNISTLTRLEFNSNGLPECIAKELAAAIASNNMISSIGIMNNNFEAAGMIAIIEAMNRLKHITYVNVYNTPFTQEVIDSLSSMILRNRELQDLYLGNNKCHKNVANIVNMLKGISKLRKLSLQDSCLTEQHAEDVATALANKPLERLDFDNNSLKASGVTVIAKSLTHLSTLKILSFHNNHITAEGADGIASIVSCNYGLTDIYLGKNKLEEGAIKVAKALKHLSMLRLLDLNDNSIPTVVANELASAILCNRYLEQLRLRGNLFKTKGIQTIAKSLSCMSTLKLVNFRNNQITEAAVDDIISILLSNPEIEHFYLGDNILQSGVSKIATALKKCSLLKTLDFDNSSIPGNASTEIASAVCNSSLETLYLRCNPHISAIKIVQALNEVSTLKYVDFNDNNMAGVIADQLATAFSKCTSLEDLRFRNNSFKTKEMSIFVQCLSNLSSLKSINFGGNRLTEESAECLLTLIKNNPAIKELYLGNNNLHAGVLKIAVALKMRLAPVLKILDVSNNCIPDRIVDELADFIGSSKLEQLYLSYNNFSLSSCVILEALSKLRTLTTLYLDGCNLADTVSDKLGIVFCNNCSLRELQLKNNHFKSSGMIRIAKSLSRLSTLKVLNIRNNSVTEEATDAIACMILSNSVLEQVYLGDNRTLNATNKILSSLKSIATLIILNLSNMGMTDQIADELAAVVTNNPLLEHLYLAGNKLLASGLNEVTGACKKHSKHLKLLDIRCNLVNPTTIDDLLYNISNIHSLEGLCLGGLTSDCMSMENILYCDFMLSQSAFLNCDTHKNLSQSALLEVVCLAVQKLNHCNLVKYNYDATFSLSFNYPDQSFYDMLHKKYNNKSELYENMKSKKLELSQIDATNLITFLPVIKDLKALDLEQTNINEEAAFELAAFLDCNNILSQLWLRGNTLSSAGALFILNSLRHTSSLRVLDLSHNNIGFQAADGIAAVIDCNDSLEQLWLDGNALLNKGVVQFTHALKHLSTLRTLSLCNTGINDEVADELSDVITNNVHLEDIMLSSNNIHSEGICKIAQSFNELIKLRKLDLFNNKITTSAADELAEALSNCCTLQELHLSDNMLETVGVIKILQALKYKYKLQVLTLSNNNVTEEVVSDLTEVLINNSMFCILLIGGNNLRTMAALKIAKTIKDYATGMRVLALCDNNIDEKGKDEIKMMLSTTYLQLHL